MHVISKRTFHFHEIPAPPDPEKPYVVLPNKRKHTIPVSPAPQPVPDWLEDDDAFQAAVDAGDIQLVTLHGKDDEEEEVHGQEKGRRREAAARRYRSRAHEVTEFLTLKKCRFGFAFRRRGVYGHTRLEWLARVGLGAFGGIVERRSLSSFR